MPFLDKQKFGKITGSGRAKTPPPKETKKDPVLGEKTYTTQEMGKKWVRKPEVYKTTGISESERVKEWEDMSKQWSFFIEKGEREKTLKKLGEEKFGAKTTAEIMEAKRKIKILKESLRK